MGSIVQINSVRRLASTNTRKTVETEAAPFQTKDKTIQNLRASMTVLLGKEMHEEQEEDGKNLLVTFTGSSNLVDVGIADLSRISRAMNFNKTMLTIHVLSGRLAFTFEIEG